MADLIGAAKKKSIVEAVSSRRLFFFGCFLLSALPLAPECHPDQTCSLSQSTAAGNKTDQLHRAGPRQVGHPPLVRWTASDAWRRVTDLAIRVGAVSKKRARSCVLLGRLLAGFQSWSSRRYLHCATLCVDTPELFWNRAVLVSAATLVCWDDGIAASATVLFDTVNGAGKGGKSRIEFSCQP
jgi:hypothetical protein